MDRFHRLGRVATDLSTSYPSIQTVLPTVVLNCSFYELPCLCLKVCFANNKEPPRLLLTASRDELHRGSKTQGQPIHGQNDITILRDNYDRGNRKIRAGVPQEMPMLPVCKAWDL